MRAPRNPRRAYDQDGNEDPPATVASTYALGMSSVMAFCEVQGCGHDAVIPLEGWPDATAVPDMALRLRCSKCGSRKIRMMLNVCELYTKVHGAGSPQPRA
ncbi:MAG TPA: hypothetical protein VFG99_09650 [Chloroflexia bacterium]|nr:hypothetical protein [Chloroflexia bacterium]